MQRRLVNDEQLGTVLDTLLTALVIIVNTVRRTALFIETKEAWNKKVICGFREPYAYSIKSQPSSARARTGDLSRVKRT